MRGIFISYRRDDAEGQAGRLFDDLSSHFGRDAVFMDVAGIKKGLDFRRIIDAHVASCGVLLVLIGKGWLAAADSKGQRRLDDVNDFVRLETAAALSRDIPVVPVLVHGAVMPTEHDLPDGLKELAYRNGTELTHARWDSDVNSLIEDLKPYLGAPATTAPAMQPAHDPSSTPTPPPAIGASRANRSVWAAGATALVVVGASAVGYLIWPDRAPAESPRIAAAITSPTVEAPRTSDTVTAQAPVPAKSAPKPADEPTKSEPTPAQVAAVKAAAAEAAAARAAATKAAAARAEASRQAAEDQRRRDDAQRAQRAAQLADEQRKRDEEARRIALEQAEKDRIAAEKAAGAKMFADFATAIIAGRQNNRR